MRTTSSSLRALGAAVGLALAVLATSAPAGAAPADRAAASTPASTLASTAASTAVLAKSSPKAWRCTKWYHGPSVSSRTCAKITEFDQTFDVDYTRTFFNKFRKKKITVQCTTSKSTTWKFGVSATVEAEAGVIFAKAKTSLTGSVERSATTTDTASATFTLKPRKYAHCERGMYEYRWRGVVKRETCHPSQGCRVTKKRYRAHAPSRDAFFIGPGRG
jgi:hypothetical protein